MNDLVAVAKISRPRGLKGEVVADVLTDFPERFSGLTSVTAVLPDGERRDLNIERAWFQKGRIVLSFSGMNSIEAVEVLRGAEICVDENEAVELDEGEYYDWQLEGCMVETVEGDRVGPVKELMRAGGTELLVVDGGGKDILVPFAEAICVEVDIDNRLIKIDPPEGLLDL